MTASKVPSPISSEPLIYSDEKILNILKNVRVIAMVGASPNWVRPSNFAMKYLQGKGYRVIPVNPGHVGKKINGEEVFASLTDIPHFIDMVDIFRSSSQVKFIADEILSIYATKAIKVVWMQLGVRNDDAAKLLEDVGLAIVMDRCPKIEHGRFFGELSWCGVNSGIISAKRRSLGSR